MERILFKSRCPSNAGPAVFLALMFFFSSGPGQAPAKAQSLPNGSPQTASSTQPIEIAFELNEHGNIIIPATLNRREPLKLLLHTATSGVSLTKEATAKLTSLTFGTTQRITTWGGEFEARTSEHNELTVGDLSQSELQIWETEQSADGSDGKFGLDFFGDRVIELDWQQLRLRLHAEFPTELVGIQPIDVAWERDGPTILLSCQLPDKQFEHRFLLHSGYGGGLLFADALVQQHGLAQTIAITKRSTLQDSAGNKIEVLHGTLPQLRVGRHKLDSVAVGFFNGQIGRQPTSVVGCQVLREFRWFFDIKHQRYALVAADRSPPRP